MDNENNEKLEFYLRKIETIFPKKSKLNQRQYCQIEGMSSTTFHEIIKNKELDKLPKFKSKEIIRKNGIPYRSYSFDIFDAAQFLAK
ncbi:hypothetical protein [Aliarcobacter cryaerophilus]|uniref:hypothetical protein n=1 Tax=Aliarcobacter cryaerophilus TaxID=28198 RepID=UPI003BB0AA28